MLLWRFGCMYLFKLVFSFSLDICPGGELLDHTIVLFLFFLKNLHTVFHSGYITYIPTNSVQGFPFLRILANIVIFDLFDDSRSDRCEMISHHGFDLHFPDDQCDVEQLFMYLLAISISSLESFLFRSSAHILIGLFLFFYCWVVWAVYIRWILTTYQSYHLQIFSPI